MTTWNDWHVKFIEMTATLAVLYKSFNLYYVQFIYLCQAFYEK